MKKVLPDTNIFIDWLNAGKYEDLLFVKGFTKYLSAVVLLELEAGAFSQGDQRLVQKLAQGFKKAGRIVVPTDSDWQAGGRILRRLQKEKGYQLSKARELVNDVLIAVSARRIGAMVVTQNGKDFEAICNLYSFQLLIV
ncbi:PIN domain-containing protein [Candidatus Bipolaricaulota bacterium]|nr:PIN domain-containing protein [Candidatus Bipolaricaulota bacterium]